MKKVLKILSISLLAFLALLSLIGYILFLMYQSDVRHQSARVYQLPSIFAEEKKKSISQYELNLKQMVKNYGVHTDKNKPVNCLEVKNNERLCLACNIYYEAGIESLLGKYMVGVVTLARSNAPNKEFPKGICKNVWKDYAFSWTLQSSLPKKDKTWWNESLILADYLLTTPKKKPIVDSYWIDYENILWFHATYVNPKWKTVEVAYKIDRHVFYKKTGTTIKFEN